MKNIWERIKPSKRKLVQLYAALLYNAYLKGFIKGEIYTGKTKYACVPGFNCYSCPGAVGACPLGSLQAALATAHDRVGFYVFGILLLYGLIAGRTICGWICPLGLLQELLHKIPTPKLKKSKVTRILSYLKYVFLVVFAIFIPLYMGFSKGMTVPGFCKYICPAGTFEGAIGLLSNTANNSLYGMLGIYFTRKFVILTVAVLACIFIYRAFCRFVCPLGAIYGLFNKFCLIGVKTDTSACNNCGLCVKKCQMDILHVSDHECIQCGKCIDVCAKGALSLKAGKIVLKANDIQTKALPEEERANVMKKRKTVSTVIWGIAIAILVFALLWFNLIEPSINAKKQPAGNGTVTTSAEDETRTIGFEPGNVLDDFTITCTDGSTFHLNDYRGKIVVINLWATYCGPCVEELPYFCEFAENHADDTVMLAVHHPLVTKEVEPFIAEKGWTIPFAIDEKEPTIVWDKVGGTTAMPQTIVIDKNGVVVENHRGSVTKEVLESYYNVAAEVEYNPELSAATENAEENVSENTDQAE